jgi:hypothetical protein
MDTQDINSQPQPEATPASAGPSADELKAQLDEMKKQSEGRLRDLQQERAKRQELEARYSSPAPSAAQPDVTEDELAKVLKPHIQQHVAPLAAELENLRVEKAQKYLETKTGKNWDAIEADREFQDRLHQVIRKYGVTGNIIERTERAYELLELENLRSKEAERVRAAQAASTQSLPSGTGKAASNASGKRYAANEFDGMSAREFADLSKKGDFRKLPDGSFEYNPR